MISVHFIKNKYTSWDQNNKRFSRCIGGSNLSISHAGHWIDVGYINITILNKFVYIKRRSVELVKIINASDRIVSRETQSGSDGSKHDQCDNVTKIYWQNVYSKIKQETKWRWRSPENSNPYAGVTMSLFRTLTSAGEL